MVVEHTCGLDEENLGQFPPTCFRVVLSLSKDDSMYKII